MALSPSKKQLGHIRKKISQLIARGQWQAADRELSPYIATRAREVQDLIIQILRGTKQWDRLDPMLDRALRDDPDNLVLVLEKGRSLLDRGLAEKALPFLERCIPIMTNEESIVDFASALFQVREVEESWAQVEKRALESSNGRLLAVAADCQYFWKNYSVALQFYQQALYYGWRNKRCLTRMAHCLRLSGKGTDAERYFRALLDYDPADVESTLGLGACFESRGLYQRALLVYQGGSAWDSGDLRLVRQAGVAAVYTGRFHFAEVYLRAVVQTEAVNPQALAFLGYCLECQRRWDDAESCYLKLVAQFPEHPAGYRALSWLFGVGLSRQVSHERGLQYARKALDLAPDAVSWEMLSACEARVGNFHKAHDIQKRLSQESDDRQTRFRRMEAMRRLRQGTPLEEQHIAKPLVA